jgi:TPR repeat protein
MKLTVKHAIAIIALALSFAVPVAARPIEDGYSAYTRGDFATAMRIMRPLADQGHVTAQTVVGLMYYFNYGGDYVSAHMWFNLAAAQGNAFAEMFLKDTADKMTPEQIAEAQKLAREWKPTTQTPGSP